MMHQRMISSLRGRLSSNESSNFRRLYSAVSVWPENRREVEKRRLYNRIWVAGSNGGKVSDVLDALKKQGKGFSKTNLMSCVKDLRKHARYHHCLEILEWMEENLGDSSDSNQALRVSIIYKVKGIDEAEKYFADLPPAAKTTSTYGALLNCYCTQKLIDKALALFKEMDELSITNTVAFNNLMGLYMKVGQPEKVPPLVQEMKQKNMELTNYSYSVLIQSYGRINDVEGVERVADEVQLQNRTNRDWNIYASLATVYIKAGQSEKAEATLKKLEEFLDNSYNPDRAAYHHLISLCASLGSVKYVTLVWNKLKSRFKTCQNLSYLNMLYALSKLDDIEGMKNCLLDWESSFQSYDIKVPTAVINACLKKGKIEDAEQLLKYATKRAGVRTWNLHVSLMKYYLEEHQVDSALKHMELAIDNRWQQFRRKINLFFDYFIKERDDDGAEKLYRILKIAKALDSEVYLGLLQTYAVAGRIVPDMRWMMEKEGVDIGPEHEKLLQKICHTPN